MEKIIIKDFDSAVEAYISTWLDDFSWDKLELSEEANIVVKLKGDQWDGALDYKVAEFVVRLQKSIVQIYNKCDNDKIKYNTRPMDEAGLRVKVVVQEGCTLFNIDLKGWWDNMESGHKCASLIVLFLLASGFGWKYLEVDALKSKIDAEHKVELAKIEAQKELGKKIEERLLEESTRKSAQESLDKALSIIEKNSGHMAFLASKMNSGDVMEVNGINIPAGSAKRVFNMSNQEQEDISIETSFLLDGSYVVSKILREKNEIIIRFSDKERVFSIEGLVDRQRQRLYSQCAKNPVNEPIPLRLKAFFKGGVFQSGVVEGIGVARKNAKTFEEASLASARIQEVQNESRTPVEDW